MLPAVALRSALRRAGTPIVLGTLAALTATGCRGDRILRIQSDPPGATVRLDDRVIGRTPLEIPFAHYGKRRLALYLTGYRTYSEPYPLDAPWWARFPIDLFTEVILPLGLDDVRDEFFVLVPDNGREAAPSTQEFIDNALRARGGDPLLDVPLAGQAPKGGPEGEASAGAETP